MPCEPGGSPVKIGVPITDLGAALYALSAILAALHHRTRTGRGQYLRKPGEAADPTRGIEFMSVSPDFFATLGLPMVRAEAVNDDPGFVDMMADVVLRTIHRYDSGRPLPILAP